MVIWGAWHDPTVRGTYREGMGAGLGLRLWQLVSGCPLNRPRKAAISACRPTCYLFSTDVMGRVDGQAGQLNCEGTGASERTAFVPPSCVDSPASRAAIEPWNSLLVTSYIPPLAPSNSQFQAASA